MAFGHAHWVEDPQEKSRALVMMDIERASAKIRAKGVADDEEDYLLPIYAERLPVRTMIAAPEPCPRLHAGAARPQNLTGYRTGRLIEEAVAAAHAAAYGARAAP